MKQWIMMVGGFLSWIPASLFSQTLWVTSLDSIDLDKSVADLKDCYAVEFLLETPAAEELPVDIYLSDIRKRDLRELQLEEPSHVRKVCLTARSLGKKRQVLTVPIKAFDTPMASEGVLRRIRSIALDVKGESRKKHVCYRPAYWRVTVCMRTLHELLWQRNLEKRWFIR